MTKNEFFALERQLIDDGHDADLDSFAVIKERLKSKSPLEPDEFARQAIYVVLAGGFSQKTAKKVHIDIMNRLVQTTQRVVIPAKAGIHCVIKTREGSRTRSATELTCCAAMDPRLRGDDELVRLAEELFLIFHNKNKTNAIANLWANRQTYRDDYYKLSNIDDKLRYIAGLPHIGKTTAHHLARNLGENVFKRDVWIDRLLSKYGEDLLERLERETSLPRGYIDVVLWKACQIGLIELSVIKRE